MAFDELRRDADTLATELGRDIQQALARFLDQVVTAAANEREALLARAEQEATEADVRIQNAVAEARREAEAALAALREESAAQLAAAVARAREDADNEAAYLIARAKDEAALESAALLAQAREEVAKAQAALQQRDEDEALNRQGREREARLAEIERLLEGFRRLDAAGTLTALLDTLSQVAAAEAARVALFLVRGRELQGWRASGFADAPGDVRSLTVLLESAGDLARPAQTRARAEVHAGSIEASSPIAFLAPRADTVGVAVPVIVGGQTAAILYADDGAVDGRVVPAGWPETLELLARHAARCLEAQTAIRAARLRRTAETTVPVSRADMAMETAPLATGSVS